MPTHAKTETQNLFNHIQQVKAEALLGYAMIGLMDNDNFGLKPIMQIQTINTWQVEQKHLMRIKTDMSTRRLQNKIMENAIIIGIHPNHINKSSLCSMTQGSYDNYVQWNPSVMEKKKLGKKCTMLLYNGNHHRHYLHQHCTSLMEYYFRLQDAKEHHDPKELKHVQHISELEKKSCQEGSWLAAFYDISK